MSGPPPILLLALLALDALLAGRALLRRLGLGAAGGPGMRLLRAAGLGVAGLCLAALAVALSGRLVPISVWALALAPMLFFGSEIAGVVEDARGLARSLACDLATLRASPWRLAGAAALGAWTLLAIGVACSPPVSVGEVKDHLFLAAQLAGRGRMAEVPGHEAAGAPGNAALLYSLLLVSGESPAPRLASLLFGVAAAGALAGMVRRRMGGSAAGTAILVFALSPPVFLAIAATASAPLLFFALLAGELIFLHPERERRSAFAAGVFAGTASGFGHGALLLLPLLAAGIRRSHAADPLPSGGRRRALHFAAGTAIPLVPWLLRGLLLSGNPFAGIRRAETLRDLVLPAVATAVFLLVLADCRERARAGTSLRAARLRVAAVLGMLGISSLALGGFLSPVAGPRPLAAWGGEDRSARHPAWPATDWANRFLPEGSRVLALCEESLYPLGRETLVAAGGGGLEFPLAHEGGALPGSALEEALDTLGITHLLWTPGARDCLSRAGLSAATVERALRGRSRLLFEENGRRVVELAPADLPESDGGVPRPGAGRALDR